jgi:hypothetical protein
LNGKCTPQSVANCQQYQLNENKCVICNPPASPTSFGTCDVLVQSSNCLEFQPGSTDCRVCHRHFYADSGRCLIQNVSFCETYFANLNKCQVCQTNFKQTSDSLCVQDLETNCLISRPDGSGCDICKDNFVSIDGSCVYQSVNGLIANCLITLQGKCSQCGFGYKVSSNALSCDVGSQFAMAFADANNSTRYLVVDESARPPALSTQSSVTGARGEYWFAVSRPSQPSFLLSSQGKYYLTQVGGRLIWVDANQTSQNLSSWVPTWVTRDSYTLANSNTNLYIQSDLTLGNNPAIFKNEFQI